MPDVLGNFDETGVLLVCPRCGGRHEKLDKKRFAVPPCVRHPVLGCPYPCWALCPVLGEPILLTSFALETPAQEGERPWPPTA